MEALVAKGLFPATSRPRCFGEFTACPRCNGTGSGDHGGPCLACPRARIAFKLVGDAPPSVAAAVALASLSDGTLAALEALAWESAEALAPWHVPAPRDVAAPSRVCGCVIPASAWRRRGHPTSEPSRYASAALAEARRGVDAMVRAFEVALGVDEGEAPTGESEALADFENAVAWRTAARAGLQVIACPGAPEGASPPLGAAFSELPDPFAARCAAWAMGCAIDSVERDGTVTIVVPA